jgi:Epoxide hydrolase N terminus
MNDVARQMDGDRTPVRPFHVNIPEAELGDMRKRIKATRWPDPETVADESQGVQLADVGGDKTALSLVSRVASSALDHDGSYDRAIDPGL